MYFLSFKLYRANIVSMLAPSLTFSLHELLRIKTWVRCNLFHQGTDQLCSGISSVALFRCALIFKLLAVTDLNQPIFDGDTGLRLPHPSFWSLLYLCLCLIFCLFQCLCLCFYLCLLLCLCLFAFFSQGTDQPCSGISSHSQPTKLLIIYLLSGQSAFTKST